ncbi:hypothetical protein P691DRAFT_794355 [Macrolepiota fuliginosa MF-IS2]|uniref:DNA recombination and repair protein Rad51-like C-terminal domain-containing protein n=1 Tax=Macrolepiota fuliginosa MF-IS2 TaxID=1400762 RepID=A0A9P5XKS2_9AGAR|nr:hypothetical protein P691DRAFT_794355 [Macrolepiota fuliginosa MF-IS2]
MSASSLFRDIQGHTLAELLTSVLHDTCPLGPTLIPPLDVHLNQTRPTAACKCSTPASGKTHLLYYILITCILPPSDSSVKLDGWGKSAVIFDSDRKFDVQRFTQLLRSRARRLLPLSPSAIEAITTRALDLLHVFRPTSSHQLAATIQHLPMYLATNLPEADLGILAVDSITAFYWPDRHLLEQIRSGNYGRTLTRSLNPLDHVLSHGPLVLLTSWNLSTSPGPQGRQRSDTPTSAPERGADKPEQQRLSVSHHIVLATPKPLTDDGENTDDRSMDLKFATTTTYLSGTVRTPSNSKTAQFILHITEDDILVPQMNLPDR